MPNFFRAFYICDNFVISFSEKFPMTKLSLSPEFGRLFEIWLKIGNNVFWAEIK